MKRMSKNIFLLVAALASSTVCAELDPSVIKDDVKNEFTTTAEKASNAVVAFTEQMQLTPEHKSMLIPSYPIAQHESFRTSSEEKALGRIEQNLNRAVSQADEIIERAVVELFQVQSGFEQTNTQDFEIFKQQFVEGTKKMAKGGHPAAIAYQEPAAPVAPAPSAPKPPAAQKAPEAQENFEQGTSLSDEEQLLREIRGGLF